MTDPKALVERLSVPWERIGGHRADSPAYKINTILQERKEAAAHLLAQQEQIAGLEAKLSTPEVHDFLAGVAQESAHQRERWGSEHDTGKAPEDWFWLLGWLAGKAVHAAHNGDVDKAKHHCISSAAVLANWHMALLGKSDMRPGIDPEERGYGT